MLTQFSPHDFTTFRWEGTASFTHYVAVVILLAVFLAAELTPFYLKSWVGFFFFAVFLGDLGFLGVGFGVGVGVGIGLDLDLDLDFWGRWGVGADADADGVFGCRLLWMEPSHPIVIARLAGIFIFGLPAVRELYQYINDPRYVHVPNPQLIKKKSINFIIYLLLRLFFIFIERRCVWGSTCGCWRRRCARRCC